MAAPGPRIILQPQVQNFAPLGLPNEAQNFAVDAVGANLNQALQVDRVGCQVLQNMPMQQPNFQELNNEIPPANNNGDRELYFSSKGIDNLHRKVDIKKTKLLQKAFTAIDQFTQANNRAELVQYNFNTGECILSDGESLFLTAEQQANIDELVDAKHRLEVDRYISSNHIDFYHEGATSPVNAPQYKAVSPLINSLKTMDLAKYTDILSQLLPANTPPARIQELVGIWQATQETHQAIVNKVDEQIVGLKTQKDQDAQALSQANITDANYAQLEQALQNSTQNLQEYQTLKEEIGEVDNYALGIQIALQEDPAHPEQIFKKAQNLTLELLKPDQPEKSWWEKFSLTKRAHDAVFAEKQYPVVGKQEVQHAEFIASLTLPDRQNRRNVQRALGVTAHKDTLPERLVQLTLRSQAVTVIDKVEDALQTLHQAAGDLFTTRPQLHQQAFAAACQEFTTPNTGTRARLEQANQAILAAVNGIAAPANGNPPINQQTILNAIRGVQTIPRRIQNAQQLAMPRPPRIN